MTLYAALPLPIVASAGNGVSLASILQQSFGATPAQVAGAWLYERSKLDLASLDFSYWNLSSELVGAWSVNGAGITADSSQWVASASFGAAGFVAGNDIGPFADVYMGSTWYTMITVDPGLFNLPAGNQEPTPADIVNEAYRFNNFYGWIPNDNDCHNIASAVAAGVGATLGPDTGSTDPTQNVDGGFWRVAYRGSDPNPVADWHTLVQAGDIVRMAWAAGGQHTTTILNVNADGSMVVYDNGDWINGVEGIGIHTVTYDQATVASSITIYRLTTDGLYLQTGDDAGDTILGTVFNDKDVCGAGNDTITGGPGNDIIDGGRGYNTACYSGSMSQYQIIQSGNSLQVADLRSGSPDGTDQLSNIERLQFSDRYETAPIETASNTTATRGDSFAASSLFAVSDAENDAITKYALWDAAGDTGYWLVNGVVESDGVEIDVTAAQLAQTSFQSASGADHLWVRAFDGTLWGAWTGFYVTAPIDHAPVVTPAAANYSATHNQSIAATSLFSVSDADNDAITAYQFWDSAGGTGHWVVGGTAQLVGQAVNVTPAQLASATFQSGSGSDHLWVRAFDGVLWSSWTGFYVNVPAPTLTVSNVASATGGQVINLANLITISDPSSVGYQKLELWDSAGTVTGGQFKINGTAQTGGHEIDVTPANVANTVFDAGTFGVTDTLWAQLQQNDGTLSGWKQFSVTVPTPTLTVHNDSTATPGQVINLPTLVTVTDSGNVGYQKLELWDSNGTAATGQFVVNGVPQTGGHEIDVSPADVANTVFDEGTTGNTDTLWARLQQNDGTLTSWQRFTVVDPLDIAPGATLEFTSPYAGTVNFIGATGTLQLDDSAAFTGTVAGLIGADTIDFRDIGFAGQPTFSGTASSGSLSVTDGVHVANIELFGDYTATNFIASSDGNGGTSIAGVPKIGSAS